MIEGKINLLRTKNKAKNPQQSLRFCAEEETRRNQSLETQMKKGLRRESEEEDELVP